MRRAAKVTEDHIVEAEHLVHRLGAQLAELRQTTMERPWQAPALKEIARLLECASRAAFAKEDIWDCLSHGGQVRPSALRCLRPDGSQRARNLLDLASQRLALLRAD